MRRIQLVGGPQCGKVVTITDDQEVRCGLVRDVWVSVSDSRTVPEAAPIGVYRARNHLDAALGRWTWREPK